MTFHTLQEELFFLIEKTIEYLEGLNLYHTVFDIVSFYYTDIESFIHSVDIPKYKQIVFKDENNPEREFETIRRFLYQNEDIYQMMYNKVKRDIQELIQHMKTWLQEYELIQENPFFSECVSINKPNVDFSIMNSIIYDDDMYHTLKQYSNSSLFLQKTKQERLQEFYDTLKQQTRMYDLMRKYNINGLKLLIQYSLLREKRFTPGEIYDIKLFLEKVIRHTTIDDDINQTNILQRCMKEIEESIQMKQNTKLDEL